MTQTLPKPVNFEEFIEWYPNDGIRYELHNGGVIIEIQAPTGEHRIPYKLATQSHCTAGF